MAKNKKGALAKDPPKTQSVKQGSDNRATAIKSAQAAYNKAKVALRNTDPSDPNYANLQKTFQDAARKAGVSGNTVKDLLGKYGKAKPAPQAAQPVQNAGPEPVTPESVAQDVIVGGGGAYDEMLNRFRGGLGQPQADFTAEMDRARQNVLGQFERRNAESFAREREATQQSILERGLDPNSPAAQAMVRDLNDRQDRARQEALASAEETAYGVQKQGFGQQLDLSKLPYEQFATLQAPFIAGLQSQYGQTEAQQKFGMEQALAKQQFGYDLKKIQAANRGAGAGTSAADNAFAQYIIGQYGNQNQPRPNPGAAFGTGLAQGAGTGITNVLNRRSGT